MKSAHSTTVNHYFFDDHDRLDRLYASFETAMNSCRIFEASQCFHSFSEGLRQHIIWEEAYLFPLFERHTGMVDVGPTVVMRREHRVIETLLVAIKSSLQSRDVTLNDSCRELSSLLYQHNQKEENLLYPAIDDLCSDLEIKTLLAELESESAA